MARLAPVLKEGDILEANYWSEPVRAIAVKVIGRRVQIFATGVNSRTAYDLTLSQQQLQEEVRITRPGLLEFSGDGVSFRLAIEAWRICLAHEFDPHFAVSVSQIDPLPHQLEAIYHYMLPRPRVRFLLADDPGAGKTIMAGLLLKELKIRGLVERTLIATPANLTDQWRRERKEVQTRATATGLVRPFLIDVIISLCLLLPRIRVILKTFACSCSSLTKRCLRAPGV